MEKLFISCPMRGRTDEEIKATMEQMHRIAEAVFDTEFEVIPTYIEEDAPECASQRLWYLGESIKKMAERMPLSESTMKIRSSMAVSSKIIRQRPTAFRSIWLTSPTLRRILLRSV